MKESYKKGDSDSILALSLADGITRCRLKRRQGHRWAGLLSGYYRYHAVPGNIERLSVFGQRLRRLWWLTLRRRSQRPVAWDRLLPIFTRWLPAPRVLHPFPIVRFLATHP